MRVLQVLLLLVQRIALVRLVRAFDSRPEVKEQVQSMGASFLEIDFKEEGGSGDGYAKVMSEEF